jgi:hypothetical protein
MTQCFQDHPIDKLVLNQNSVPISECQTKTIHVYDQNLEVIDVPILTGECIWRVYQREAEEIVAPGGKLIEDPKERNRAINAAYARLWLHDNRFQWAGLAAFASKQVGCGLLHAADSIENIQAEHEAAKGLGEGGESILEIPGLFRISKNDEQAVRDLDEARRNNPVPSMDVRRDGELSLAQQQYQHVYEMMALGNTLLFLDVFPLHAFYAKRGWAEFKHCLPLRQNIYGHPRFPVFWPIEQKKLEFGLNFPDILYGFQAIEEGRIADSVNYLARHEQQNILQPTMYNDTQLKLLLRLNHVAYVTRMGRKVAEPIELTLASQCKRLDDGRTVSFDKSAIADLSNFQERMTFVLSAAAQFDELLNGPQRSQIEKAILDIAAGLGIR